jgi:hypothetical protein
MFTLSSPLGVKTLYYLEEWRGEQRISPPGDKIHPWGTTTPLGSKLIMGLPPRCAPKQLPHIVGSSTDKVKKVCIQNKNFSRLFKASSFL